MLRITHNVSSLTLEGYCLGKMWLLWKKYWVGLNEAESRVDF